MNRQPAFAAEWLAQRQSGERFLDTLHRRELRELTEEAALPRIEALLSMATSRRVADDRWASSGFVQQQAVFSRGRR